MQCCSIDSWVPIALCKTGITEMKRISRLFLGVAGLSSLVFGLYCYQNRMDTPEVVVAQQPAIEVTPEILTAINQKLSIVKVAVPLGEIDVPVPDRTTLWGLHTIERGQFSASGRLFVAFEQGHAESDGHHVEITLGKPVLWGLDENFTTHVHDVSSVWSNDPHFVDNARKVGRSLLLSKACRDGAYTTSSVTASVLMTDFVKSIASGATVTVNTTDAHCAS